MTTEPPNTTKATRRDGSPLTEGLGAGAEAKRQRERAQRNLDPHKGAVAAMWLWGAAYAAQRGGSMDFWDSLTEDQRRQCVRLVQDIECARPVPLSA